MLIITTENNKLHASHKNRFFTFISLLTVRIKRTINLQGIALFRL